MVVEDEDGLRVLVAEMLRRFGYTVLETSRGEDALLCCDCHPQPFHLLLTDVVLPQMNGRKGRRTGYGAASGGEGALYVRPHQRCRSPPRN